MPQEIVLKGYVLSGNKQGKLFVDLPWVKKQINEKIGFNPYPGTLNLRMTNKVDLDRLRNVDGIIIVPEEGYYKGKCFKVLVSGKVEGAIVLPDVPDYPSDMLEVLAPVNLREMFGLKDGMEVEVTIRIK